MGNYTTFLMFENPRRGRQATENDPQILDLKSSSEQIIFENCRWVPLLIVRLICHDEKVYEEIIFCKASQYKSQLHFPSQNNRTCTKRTYKQQSIFYQEEIQPMGFFPSFSIYFNFDQITSTKVTLVLREIAPEMQPSIKNWKIIKHYERLA